MRFWDWFIGEAGAAWILGILGIIGAIYTWINRRRPKHIVLQETQRFSLLDIHHSLQERLTVFYKSRVDVEEYEIRTLYQTEFIIYNSGTESFAQPLEFTVDFYPTEKKSVQGVMGYWEMLFDDSRADCECLDDEQPSIGCTVQLDGLNSWPRERDFIQGYLVSEESIFLDTRYQGTGWSTEHRCVGKRPPQLVAAAISLVVLVSIGLPLLLGWTSEHGGLLFIGAFLAIGLLTPAAGILAGRLLEGQIGGSLVRRFPLTPYDLIRDS
jgi:hypothetical protein